MLFLFMFLFQLRVLCGEKVLIDRGFERMDVLTDG